MLVHSCLYYHMDCSIISDDKWQQWADELTELQKEQQNIGFYDEAFKDWDGSTGMHLPTSGFVVGMANRILNYKEK